ncbi:MAG: endonuclease/exonuclease/phosphatase family protein [Micromonosporaceae bacterium]|nr:endonuclease/exonuclease/phosphatase family protein [Micromonosporaceae bacterium]
MKRALSILVAALLGTAGLLVAPATAGADTPAARQVQLRVLSYNIFHGAGADGVFDLSRTAAAIRETGADIVGLEEVDQHWGDRSQWTDEAAELGAMLGMHSFFAHIYDLPPVTPGQPNRRYGLAILSRYPIVHAENHWITRLSTQDPNPTPASAPGFPEAVVNVRGALVHVYATHLDFRSDPSVRHMQVRDTLAILAQDRPHAQQVLMGDFNAGPDAPELAPLWERVTDAWTVAGEGPGLTYPAEQPAERIDYVTVSPGIGVTSVSVPATLASDHRPVLASLTVTRGW